MVISIYDHQLDWETLSAPSWGTSFLDLAFNRVPQFSFPLLTYKWMDEIPIKQQYDWLYIVRDDSYNKWYFAVNLAGSKVLATTLLTNLSLGTSICEVISYFLLENNCNALCFSLLNAQEFSCHYVDNIHICFICICKTCSRVLDALIIFHIAYVHSTHWTEKSTWWICQARSGVLQER